MTPFLKRPRTSIILGRPFCVFVLSIFLMLGNEALAGPPFLTDDPQPVDYGHYEFYLFSTLDKTKEGSIVQGPAVEFNAGVLPNMQFHIVLPFTLSLPKEGPKAYGLGDTEIGLLFAARNIDLEWD